MKRGARVLVACSGGPDSVALARLFVEIQTCLGTRVEIAHVNHALRGRDSTEDERFVRRLAKQLGWRCHVMRCPIKPLASGNLEEIAREKRYAALAALAKKRKAMAVFTAHTLDDQAETVFMNLMRGVGPDGLAGMAPVRSLGRSGVALCRPFLEVSKKELLEWLSGYQQQFRKDRSNANTAFLRNWLRTRLLPSIEKKSAGFMRRIGRLATLALDEKRHWDAEMEALEAQLLKPHKKGRLLDLRGLLRYSPAIQRRFLRRSLGRDVLTFEAVERLREWMQSPPTGGRLWQLKKGWIVERLSKSKGSPSPQLFWFKQFPLAKEKTVHEKI